MTSRTDTPGNRKSAGPARETAIAGEQFNLVEYFKGVKQEWHRVTWPPREQIIAETGIVILLVALFSGFVFGVDKLFQFILQWIT